MNQTPHAGQASDSFELIKRISTLFSDKTEDLRRYIYVAQLGLPVTSARGLAIEDPFSIANSKELSIDPKLQSVFDFVSLLNYDSILNKFSYESEFTVLEFGLDDSSRFAMSQKLNRDLVDFEAARTTVQNRKTEDIRREITQITDRGQAQSIDASKRAKTIELKGSDAV